MKLLTLLLTFMLVSVSRYDVSDDKKDTNLDEYERQEMEDTSSAFGGVKSGQLEDDEEDLLEEREEAQDINSTTDPRMDD